jgi:hypothetical protein
MDSGPLQIESHFDADTGWWIFSASCKQISLRYSNIVGDCVHNLRSSLDQLVAQLVIAGGGRPNRKHQFPITQKPNDFNRQAKTQLMGVSEAHRAIIERAQPYDERDDGSGAPQALTVLNDLSNRDKHRLINAVMLVAGAGQPWWLNFGGNADAGPLGEIRMLESRMQKDGEELARVNITPVGPNPEVSILRGHVPGQIVIVDWELPVIPTLLGIAQQVARVLDNFEPMFRT